MPRPLALMPDTVTLDNETGYPVDLAGLAALEASESGKVIDLADFDTRSEGERSRREQLWNAIAGAVEQGAVTIAASSPTLGSVADVPSFDFAGLALRPGLPGYVADTVRPEIDSVSVGAGTVFIDVTFTEGVYSASDPDGPVDAGDFVLSNFAAGGGTITGLELSGTATKADTDPLVGGETVVRLGITVSGTADANATFDLAPAPGAIVDDKGNGAVEVAEADIASVAP